MNAVHPAVGVKTRFSRLESGEHTENELGALAEAEASWYPFEKISLIASLGIGGGYISDSTPDSGIKLATFTIESELDFGYAIGDFSVRAMTEPSIDMTKSGIKSCAILETGLIYRFNNGDKK